MNLNIKPITTGLGIKTNYSQLHYGKLKQVGLGKGLMDYKFLIKTIKENFDDAYLIFEGVVGDDIDESLEFINNLLSE